MLAKTVYFTVLCHLWNEIFIKSPFFLQKIAERKHRKVLFAIFFFFFFFFFLVSQGSLNVSEDRLPCGSSISSVDRDIRKTSHTFFCSKVAERKQRKFSFSNFNFYVIEDRLHTTVSDDNPRLLTNIDE